MIFLGYDPGGTTRGGNGVACIELSASGKMAVESDCLHTPNDALKWLQTRKNEAFGLGIDTMLHWVIGDRDCDKFLRRKYGINSGTVQTLGSLRGAMIGYGVLVARALGLPLFEANPKAAIAAGILGRYEDTILLGRNEDARDAIIAALAVCLWKQGEWAFDLFEGSKSGTKGATSFFPAGDALYPWPERLEG